MVLNKRNTQSARWDHSNNKWSIGTREYQWFDENTKEESPWMNLDSALLWIKERDQKKILESLVPPEKNSKIL